MASIVRLVACHRGEITSVEGCALIDIRPLANRYRSDDRGRPAYDLAILIKRVLCGDYKGMIFSRRLAAACNRNVRFMALSANARPHSTAVTDFG